VASPAESAVPPEAEVDYLRTKKQVSVTGTGTCPRSIPTYRPRGPPTPQSIARAPGTLPHGALRAEATP
jgi:hypothetical protein